MNEQVEKKGIFNNGSIWLRADFHLHTKADSEFEYIGEEDYYYSRYVDKISEEKINIGVITNHNKFDLVEYEALYKTAKKKDIYLMPGVELSVNDGKNCIHTLVVFDRDSWFKNNSNFIDNFLVSSFEGENKTDDNSRCKYSIIGLLEKLDEHRRQGRDSFIIFAHVHDSCGFLEQMDGGRIIPIMKNELFKKTVLGFQKFRNFDDKYKYEQWFNGFFPSLVEGSDPKSIDEVGRSHKQGNIDKKTYIKIGEFNFEAIKYALSDKENRLRDEIPEISNSYIKSISFEGGKLNGKKINFSPELNNLIGIRGSGKSSILEILRYSLGIELMNTSVDEPYKSDLIRYIMGSGGKSIISIVNKNNKEYRIEKIYGQRASIFEEEELKEGISLDGIDFKQPIYFGQKDLSNKDNDFEFNLLKRLVGNKLEDKEREIAAKKQEIRNLILEIEKLNNLEDIRKETNLQLSNSNEKLNRFKELKVDERLKKQTEFDSDVTKINNINSSVTDLISDTEDIISKFSHFFNQTYTLSEQNSEIQIPLLEYLSELKVEYKNLKKFQNSTISIKGKIDILIQQLNNKKENMKEGFAEIKRQLNSDTINPDDFLNLNRIIEFAKIKINEIEKSEVRRQELINKLNVLLDNLNNLWRHKYRIVEQEIEKINSHNKKLSIEIESKGNRNKFKEKLQQVFRGSGIREASYDSIRDKYRDFIQIYLDKTKLNDILNDNQRNDFNNIFQNNISDLLTFEVDNKITIEYNGKLLKNHSLGQRATALILFLLAQEDNDVLIIDQPEDDLDNQTIYDEVIKEIKKLKGNMQFIFATHNANIPVLGDSEKIITCSFNNNIIDIQEGSIDNREIQRNIVKIMEGGDEAFTRRKNIYGIWNI